MHSRIIDAEWDDGKGFRTDAEVGNKVGPHLLRMNEDAVGQAVLRLQCEPV